MQEVVFGSGCFWCTEAVFKMLKGVASVEPGYAGGTTEDPTYEQVSTGKCGHAEVARIVYDPEVISFHNLLTVFFASHNPTTLNRQGADVGTQYRSTILYLNNEQKLEAENMIRELNTSSKFGDPIVTTVEKLEKFYPAEGYHHNYYSDHADQPYCQVVINPKLAKVKKEFVKLIASQD